MLRGDFMPRSKDAALEQAEGRFDGIGMYIAMRVFAGMIDSLVKVLLHLVERPRIDGGFIGHNHFDVTPDVRIDDIPNGLRLRILSADQPQISVALPDS